MLSSNGVLVAWLDCTDMDIAGYTTSCTPIKSSTWCSNSSTSTSSATSKPATRPVRHCLSNFARCVSSVRLALPRLPVSSPHLPRAGLVPNEDACGTEAGYDARLSRREAHHCLRLNTSWRTQKSDRRLPMTAFKGHSECGMCVPKCPTRRSHSPRDRIVSAISGRHEGRTLAVSLM